MRFFRWWAHKLSVKSKHVNRSRTAPEPQDVEKDVAMVERGLKAVYLDAKGRVPDLGSLEKSQPSVWRRRMLVGTALLCALLVFGWAGLSWIEAQQTTAEQLISLRLEGPESVSLGAEQSYELRWQNLDAAGMPQIQLRLNVPSDFTITELTPKPTDPVLRIWTFANVPGGLSGAIRVKGFFVGALGGQTALQALATYRASRPVVNPQASVLRSVSYTGTVLAGNILFPERVIAGEPMQVRYLVANVGKEAIGALEARLQFPAGFIPATATSVTVDLVERRAVYAIGTLAPNTFYTAVLSGTFASGMNGDAVFQADTGRRSLEGGFLAAARSESRVAVSPGDLIVQLVANGSQSERSIEPGEPLRVSLTYQNVSDEPMRNLELTLEAESLINGHSATGTSLLDWSELDDPVHGVSSTRTRVQTLTYTKAQQPALSDVIPGLEGALEIGWPTLAVTSGTEDAVIRLTAVARVQVAGAKRPRVIRSQPVSLMYRSDADVLVEARYFTEEGAPLGSGPLPPVANKTTTYRIYWRVTKALHELTGTRVTAALPKIVAWVGKTEAESGAFTYDEAARIVTWNVGALGADRNVVEGWFDVALTPQAVDVGRFASLLGETSFQAQDARLNEGLTRVKPALNTDVSQDEAAAGKGVVRRE